jgi:hypothetical protein
MTDIASFNGESASGVPSVSDDGLGRLSLPPGPSSQLADLKHERRDLRQQLVKLEKGRLSLEQASLRLGEVEAERKLLADDHAALLSEWIKSGCDGLQPVADPARTAADIGPAPRSCRARRQSRRGALNEILQQIAETGSQLKAVQAKIDIEALAVLTDAENINGAVLALQAAVAEANGLLAELWLVAILDRDRQGGAIAW